MSDGAHIEPWLWPLRWRWDGRYRTPEEALAAGAYAERKMQALLWAHAAILKWVVVGGESGPGAREMDPKWAREIRDQCAMTKTPFFMKQMSRREPIPADLMIREFPA